MSAKRFSAFRLCCDVCLLLLLAGSGWAQSAPAPKRVDTPEQRTARAFDAIRGNPAELRAFLFRMPKGADLHTHLSGTVYAESWIRAASQDHLCVNLAKLAFAQPQSVGAAGEPSCKDGDVAAASAYKDQHLYDSLVDSFSMRDFVPSTGNPGSVHFFEAFAKYGGTRPSHAPEWLDEAARRAAAQNEQYLEVMLTPKYTRTPAIATEVGWNDNFIQLKDQLLAKGLRDDVPGARAYLDDLEDARRKLEHCGEADESPACRLEIRYIYQVYRTNSKEQVFAQTLLGMEIASADPRFVAINFVQREDAATSMTDYALQMRMVGFLHSVYPKIHITLHAGELAFGMVPPDGLCCHIRLAVEEAHAERIGHGVDVMYEDRPNELLKEMAAKHVMVEINLSSNEAILGVKGSEHPFPVYRKYGVPVALSTDDEGILRIDLTHEYERAVESYGLRYADVKKIARTSLEHSFLPGASLWSDPEEFRHRVAACPPDSAGKDKPSAGCAAFLKSSEKATQQWELERRFSAFESSF